MSGAPTVSVVMPTFNRARHLPGSIAGVLAQSPGVLELIVVDDGSTDDTREVLAGLSDPRLRVVPIAHRGAPAPARNEGIRLARGTWVAFCDSDDVWLPGKVARQLEVARREPDAVIVSSRCRFVSPAGDEFGSSPGTREVGRVSFDRLVYGNVLPCSATMVRRDAALDLGGFCEDPRLRAVEDYELWLRLARRGSVWLTRDVVVEYLQHVGGISHGRLGFEMAAVLFAFDRLEADGVPAAELDAGRRAARARLVKVAFSRPLATAACLLDFRDAARRSR